MGSTFQADIPGNRYEIVENTASVTANGADNLYQPIFRVPQAGTFKNAYWMSSASQDSHGTNYRTLQIINLGAAGAGTVVLASYALTASKAANVPYTMVNNATAANLALAAGDVLAFVTVVAASGIDVNAGVAQIEYQKN